MSKIVEALLQSLPTGGQVQEIYIGAVWTAAFVRDASGQLRAGLAANSYVEAIESQTLFKRGSNLCDNVEALSLAKLAREDSQVLTAAGIAVINALLRPDPNLLADTDAADWLVANGKDKHIVMVGRFPFVNELKSAVGKLSVLELRPQAGDFHASQAPALIPQADILAVTGSTLVNHSLDGVLALAQPSTEIMLLGPTTPLSSVLFDFGPNLLSGVQAIDLEILKDSIGEGVNFQRMSGVRRVTLQKPLS